MAVVLRGWSRTASTALKLATAERIIGYQFNNIDRLYEALDQEKYSLSLPSGKKPRERTRNTRLALVGDAQAKLYLTQKWYDNQDLTGTDWSRIAMSTLSNENLGEFGFQLGLDECTIPKNVEKRYDMATTVEAVFAAVQMDGASQEQFHKVLVRFGLQHQLVDPIQRAWIYQAVKSRLGLPNRFFIGHHFKLQQAIFDTQLRQSTAQGEKSSEGRVKRSWGSIKKLWRTMKWIWLPPRKTPEKPKKMSVSLQGQKGRVLGPVTQSPEAVKPLVEGSRPTGTNTVITPSEDVATSETNILGEESLDRFEDDERAAAPEQRTDTEDPVKKHEVAESSPTEVPTPSQPRKRRARFVPPKRDTLADDKGTNETDSQHEKPQARPVPAQGDASAADVGTTGNGSQDFEKASGDETATNSSRNDDVAAGAEEEDEHQPRKAGLEPVEATEAGDSQEETDQTIKELRKTAKELLARQVAMERSFRDLRLAGQKRPQKQLEKFAKLLEHRELVKEQLLEKKKTRLK